ncbi:gliding motility lipoprotein GldD [Aquimarina rhabdastrellae]
MSLKKLNAIVGLMLIGLLYSCASEVLPKPKAMLRLSYPEAAYENVTIDGYPFRFEKNKMARIKSVIRNKKYWSNLEYPELKATVYLSYYKVKNNLDSLLKDAQNITQEHVVKADGIIYDLYENKERKVYGTLYEVTGDAASQTQFYVTDSTDNFITGSVYFKAKPNYDSILPASTYILRDVERFMDTVEWTKEE